MRILITGGAGFIGCNIAKRFLDNKAQVIVLDNLSRRGTKANLDWLVSHKNSKNLTFINGDIRSRELMDSLFTKPDLGKIDIIFHMAAQVAVTTSVGNPREDFEINALGTFNLLEAIRHSMQRPIIINASTNKVYGEAKDIKLFESKTRYRYRYLKNGISENHSMDFHSPYGCCYSNDTDIMTHNGWKKFFELLPNDEVLTYNLEDKVAQYQKPTNHFVYHYKGKMYVQVNRRLKTCVTPNHKMLVSWDCNHNELENPRLLMAQSIAGKSIAYLLAANMEGGEDRMEFILPEVKADKNKWHFPARSIPMDNWLRFLGWYLSEGHCYKNPNTGGCTVTLTTYYRTKEAVKVMRAIGLSPVIDKHHITAGSRQLYEYLKKLGKSHEKYIPRDIKNLSPEYLSILLKSLLDGDGNQQSRHSWRYTTASRQLADDVQEIALKCGMAVSVNLDKEGFNRVYISTTRTAQCNLGKNRSKWVNYEGRIYCVEVPNSAVMVRQNGHAYFSGNSKGSADQYIIDYARIYGLKTINFRQSCIYGPRQFGVEDQGWVAHFIISAVTNRPISIYGDGKQVRDILYIDDLVDAFLLASKRLNVTCGKSYNIGGGVRNSISLLEFIALLEDILGKRIKVKFGDWRPGDQKIYVSDIRLARKEFGWKPRIDAAKGIGLLVRWVMENRGLYE